MRVTRNVTRKATGVLALAGIVWVLGLCFSSPSATYRHFRGLGDRVTVKCEPLVDPNREPRDSDSVLTSEQEEVVEKYVAYEKEGRQDDNARAERIAQLRVTSERILIAGCESARLDRLANIGLIAFLTIVPILITVRPGQVQVVTPA